MEKNFTDDNDLNFFTGAGGVLYPPKCFHKNILDEKSIMELCPSNDDIWLNWMVKLNNYKIKYSGINKEFIMIKVIKSGLFKKMLSRILMMCKLKEL